jgi:hypothetical protein
LEIWVVAFQEKFEIGLGYELKKISTSIEVVKQYIEINKPLNEIKKEQNGVII